VVEEKPGFLKDGLGDPRFVCRTLKCNDYDGDAVQFCSHILNY
jgi:hypothetical protein